MDWLVERRRARAAELHALGLPEPAVRTVRVLEVTAPALVLGSSQPPVQSDAVDVVRRRSGGGAVLVEPDRVAWLDVVVPRDDPLWDDDVGRAFWWLGDVWVAALGDIGVTGAVVHRGPFVRSPLSDVVCFAGLGAGEVTVGGAKAVGMAQRRVRAGALFQCAVPLAWDARHLAALLGLDDLDIAVHPLEEHTAEEVAAAFLAHMPH